MYCNSHLLEKRFLLCDNRRPMWLRFRASFVLFALLCPALRAGAQSPAVSSVEVNLIVESAVKALNSDSYAIAVVDRGGDVLAVWLKPGASMEMGEKALSLARTGAFFSNDQAPLSSRTVRYISGIHFPPGTPFQPNAALYGIENTNRGCSLNADFNAGKFVPRAKSLAAFLSDAGITPGPPLVCDATDQSGCGVGISTGKFTGNFVNGKLVNIPDKEFLDQVPQQVDGGGIPIFKSCHVVGGVGVYGVPPNQAEYAAFIASVAAGPLFGPQACLKPPGAVYLDGIRLPFVSQTARPAGTAPGALSGEYLVAPQDGQPTPDGWLVGGPDNPKSSAEMSSDETESIITNAINAADQTRAAIRLPSGSRTRMVMAVSDLQGNLLGLYRMPDSTVFSIDVAVAKSRNVVYFSGAGRDPADIPGLPLGTATTNRTISFTSQPLYPPGIDGSGPGPSFDLYIRDFMNPCSQGLDTGNPPNRSGVVFFPGSVPLYKNGVLVGGLGVSGDGVEQDDVVSAAGGAGFGPPVEIRADGVFIGGARLPYLKFDRNPQY
jgi:uncharacterized protein GlcG (DUF336 family)